MTAPQPPTGLRPALARALPRVAVAASGLGLATVADHGVLADVGFIVFLLSVATKPTTWWRYVRTGTVPATPPAAEYAEPGPFDVQLLHAGARPFDVMKALRDVTAVDAVDARIRVEATPALVAEQLSDSSARRVRERLERAGATASIVPAGDRPPSDPGERTAHS